MSLLLGRFLLCNELSESGHSPHCRLGDRSLCDENHENLHRELYSLHGLITKLSRFSNDGFAFWNHNCAFSDHP